MVERDSDIRRRQATGRKPAPAAVTGAPFCGSAWARQDCPLLLRRCAVLTRPTRSRGLAITGAMPGPSSPLPTGTGVVRIIRRRITAALF